MVGFCLSYCILFMSSCASHLHTCSSHASEHFPRCPFCIPALLRPPAPPFAYFRVRVLRSRIGPRLAKRPWYTTGRPHVKFRAIWSPFDTPTVNWGTVKSSCVLQPNTPPKWPQTPSILVVVRSRSCGRKPHLIWTLLAPSIYKYVHPSSNPDSKP